MSLNAVLSYFRTNQILPPALQQEFLYDLLYEHQYFIFSAYNLRLNDLLLSCDQDNGKRYAAFRFSDQIYGMEMEIQSGKLKLHFDAGYFPIPPENYAPLYHYPVQNDDDEMVSYLNSHCTASTSKNAFCNNPFPAEQVFPPDILPYINHPEVLRNHTFQMYEDLLKDFNDKFSCTIQFKGWNDSLILFRDPECTLPYHDDDWKAEAQTVAYFDLVCDRMRARYIRMVRKIANTINAQYKTEQKGFWL